MATRTVAQAGNWSSTSTWSGGVVPGNGDTVDLHGYVVTADIATVPASGTLTLIEDTVGGGTLTFPLNTLGNSQLNASQIKSGTSTTVGLITITGAAPTATLTIGTAGNTCAVTGGTTANAIGIYHNSTGSLVLYGNISGNAGAIGLQNNSTGSVTVNGSATGGTAGGSPYRSNAIYNVTTGPVTVVGNITGGSGNPGSSTGPNGCYGLLNSSTGSVSVTGTVSGGSGQGAAGIFNTSTGVVTITGNLINTATALAFMGNKPPTWTPAASNYFQSGSTYYAAELPTTHVLTGDTNGTADGSGNGGAGTLTLPTNDQLLYGVSCGVGGNSLSGDVTLPNTNGHTPNAALVLTTAHFGVSNGTAGTASAAGGGAPVFGGHVARMV